MDASLVLEDFFSWSGIPPIISRLKSRSLWSSFRWSTIRKFLESPALRYHATFKVRKFDLFFYKINTFLQKDYHLHWIAARANILCKYVIYLFSNFGRCFCGSFSMLFPKAPASRGKNILK